MENQSYCKEELERYSRHILLYGLKGQTKISKATIGVIGCGGLGNAALPYLASSGVGQIIIADDDHIDRSNLGRQTLFTEADIDKLKSETVKSTLQKLNPHIKIEAHSTRVNENNFSHIFGDCELILEGSDSIETKFLLNKRCVKDKKDLIIGALGANQGHIFPVVNSMSQSCCYNCLFETLPNPEDVPNCSTNGVLSPLPGVAGTMMALLAIKLILGENIANKIYLIEGLGWRTIDFMKKPTCKICNTASKLLDDVSE